MAVLPEKGKIDVSCLCMLHVHSSCLSLVDSCDGLWFWSWSFANVGCSVAEVLSLDGGGASKDSVLVFDEFE